MKRYKKQVGQLRHLGDVLTFSGVTAAVGGSQPLQLYCHRHNSIIVTIIASIVTIVIP